MRDCIWFLLTEAMETERSIAPPGPKLQRKHGVDYHHTAAEIFQTEVAMTADKIAHGTSHRTAPSRAAHDRHSEVMTWFRFALRKNRHRAGKHNCRCSVCLLVSLANGVTARRLGDIIGASHTTVLRRKKAALDRIERGLLVVLRGL